MPVVNLSPGDQILVDDYNALAAEINRLFSDKSPGLVHSVSNLIVNETAPLAGYPADHVFTMSPVPTTTDFVVVTQNNLTLTENSEWTRGTGEVLSLAVVSGGTGYNVGNRIRMVGGTSETAAEIEITSTAGQAITGWTIVEPGEGYSVEPASFTTESVTGTGAGATFTATFDSLNELTFLDAIPSNAVIQIFNRTENRLGWGQQASVEPITTDQLIIVDEDTLGAYLEANTNNLIDKTNIMLDRGEVGSALTRVQQGNDILAADYQSITTTIDNFILTGPYWNSPNKTLLPNEQSFTRTDPWDTQLVGEMRFTWDTYELMRYFFNSGNDLRCFVDMTGDIQDAGYNNWKQVARQMGSAVFNYADCTDTGVSQRSTSTGIGAYELTSAYQTIYISSSPRLQYITDGLAPGEYGDYVEYSDYGEYGIYENLFIRLEARLVEDAPAAGQVSIDIRITMDDSSFLVQDIAGTTTFTCGYTIADEVIDNSATFNLVDRVPVVTPALTVLNDFQSGDDS